jgi:hypothetical protein
VLGAVNAAFVAAVTFNSARVLAADGFINAKEIMHESGTHTFVEEAHAFLARRLWARIAVLVPATRSPRRWIGWWIVLWDTRLG